MAPPHLRSWKSFTCALPVCLLARIAVLRPSSLQIVSPTWITLRLLPSERLQPFMEFSPVLLRGAEEES